MDLEREKCGHGITYKKEKFSIHHGPQKARRSCNINLEVGLGDVDI